MITQTYNLNMVPSGVPVVVNASRYDKISRTLSFNIYNGSVLFSIPSGTTITIRGTKPDKTGFEYACTYSGSVVSVNIQAQMTAISGDVLCEIRLVKGSELLGTANFILRVEKSALADDTIISETDLPLLETAEQNAIRAEAAADRAESVVATAVKKINNVGPDSNGNVTISGGAGIQINNNTISNVFNQLTSPNLDDIKYNYQGYATSSTNKPAEASSSGELCCWFRNDGMYGTQLFMGYNSTKLYLRQWRNGTWTDWTLVSTEELLGVPATSIPENSDLNSYTTLGVYKSANTTVSATLVNIPSGLTGGFKLIVNKSHSNSGTIQTILSTTTNIKPTVYWRVCWDGTWGNWVPNLENAYGTINSNISKANLYNLANGTYEITGDATPVALPSAVQYGGILSVLDTKNGDKLYICRRTANLGDPIYNVFIGHMTSNSTVVWTELTRQEEFDGFKTVYSQSCTLNADAFENYSSGVTPVCNKQGNIVTLAGVVKPTNNIAYSTIATKIGDVPYSCRPKNQAYAVCHGSGTAIWLLSVKTDGEFNFARYSDENGQKTCNAGDWLPFTITYIAS